MMNDMNNLNSKVDTTSDLRDLVQIQPQEIHFEGWTREDDEIILSDLEIRDRD